MGVIECDESEELEGDGADVCRCSWMTAVLSCEVLHGSADDRTAAFLCVSPYQRLRRSAILYTKKLCRVCI